MQKDQLKRIIKLLNLTQSDNDAEALSAIRKVNEMLITRNITWSELINYKEPKKTHGSTWN